MLYFNTLIFIYVGGSQLGVRDIITWGARSLHDNDRVMICLLLSCRFLFSFAMDYTQPLDFIILCIFQASDYYFCRVYFNGDLCHPCPYV